MLIGDDVEDVDFKIYLKLTIEGEKISSKI